MFETAGPPTAPPRTSLFEDIIHWTTAYPWFSCPRLSDIKQVFTQPILHLVCAEWNIMCEYIKTRLGQIEWELGFPEQFHTGMDQDLINLSVRRLHTWRRLIPLYREMLAETTNEFVLIASHLAGNDKRASSGAGNTIRPGSPSDYGIDKDIMSDFEIVSSQMKELQDRTDRLTSVLMAAISIDDSRRGLQENKNVARLTWLATVFIPLTFISSFFSMQPDISSLKNTFGWYFATAVPVTALALGSAMNITLLHLPRRRELD